MNKLRAIITTSAIAVVMTVTAQADDKADKSISFDNNGTIMTYETNAETLGEFVNTLDDAVVDSYIIDADLNTPLEETNSFEVEEKVTVTINLDIAGVAPIRLKYPSGITVGEIIEDLETQYPGKTFFYETGELDKVIDSNYLLNFKTGSVETVTKFAPIPYETTKVESDDLYVGETKVQTPGVEGLHEVEVIKTYYNGDLVERTEKELQLVDEPITEVMLVGTKEKPFTLGSDPNVDVSTLDYSKKLTMNATAYTASGNAKTASGRVAQEGVVAVDTSVIPFGTKLYIPGYGYAVAGDTGGAIKGNKIDLFYDTVAECYEFGRRNVDVYVLN